MTLLRLLGRSDHWISKDMINYLRRYYNIPFRVEGKTTVGQYTFIRCEKDDN